jgi:hypothetical protein
MRVISILHAETSLYIDQIIHVIHFSVHTRRVVFDVSWNLKLLNGCLFFLGCSSYYFNNIIFFTASKEPLSIR